MVVLGREIVSRSQLTAVLCVVVAVLAQSAPAAAAPAASLFATYQPTVPSAGGAGLQIQVPVTLTNVGTETWNAPGRTDRTSGS